MHINKQVLTKWAAIVALIVSCLLALFTLLAIVSLIVSQEVDSFGIYLFVLLLYLFFIVAQIVLSTFLYQRKKGKCFIIPLIILFSFHVFVAIIYFMTGMTSLWDIIQFILSLITLMLLIVALSFKNEHDTDKDSVDGTKE